jgi:hypothetical protein
VAIPGIEEYFRYFKDLPPNSRPAPSSPSNKDSLYFFGHSGGHSLYIVFPRYSLASHCRLNCILTFQLLPLLPVLNTAPLPPLPHKVEVQGFSQQILHAAEELGRVSRDVSDAGVNVGKVVPYGGDEVMYKHKARRLQQC